MFSRSVWFQTGTGELEARGVPTGGRDRVGTGESVASGPSLGPKLGPLLGLGEAVSAGTQLGSSMHEAMSCASPS